MAEDPAVVARRDFLLRIYDAERNESRHALQMLLGLITISFAFIVPVVGYAVGRCMAKGVTLSVFSDGCEPALAPFLTWVAPLPVLALIGLLVCNQFVLESGGTYIKRLEDAI